MIQERPTEDMPARATVEVRRADGTVEYHRWEIVVVDGVPALRCEQALTLGPGEEVSIIAEEPG